MNRIILGGRKLCHINTTPCFIISKHIANTNWPRDFAPSVDVATLTSHFIFYPFIILPLLFVTFSSVKVPCCTEPENHLHYFVVAALIVFRTGEFFRGFSINCIPSRDSRIDNVDWDDKLLWTNAHWKGCICLSSVSLIKTWSSSTHQNQSILRLLKPLTSNCSLFNAAASPSLWSKSFIYSILFWKISKLKWSLKNWILHVFRMNEKIQIINIGIIPQ